MKTLTITLALLSLTLGSCATYKKLRNPKPVESISTEKLDTQQKSDTKQNLAPENPAQPPAANLETPTPQPTDTVPTIPSEQPEKPRPHAVQNNGPFIQPDGVFTIPDKDDLKESAPSQAAPPANGIVVPKH